MVTLAESPQQFPPVPGGHTRSIPPAIPTCIGWSHSFNPPSNSHLYEVVSLAESAQQFPPVSDGYTHHTCSTRQVVLTRIGRSNSLNPSRRTNHTHSVRKAVLTRIGRSHSFNWPMHQRSSLLGGHIRSICPTALTCIGRSRPLKSAPYHSPV